MNEIVVPHGIRDKLVKLYGTSYPTVRAALKGTSKSLLSFRIRKGALENGGVEIVAVENNKKQVML